jgi:cell division protein FtsQ
MSVTVPADRHFRRAASRPARHARTKTRWWIRATRAALVLGLLATGGYQGALAAKHSPVFAVRAVVLEGNARLSSGEADALLTGLRGENLLTANLEQWRERLRASSWVADAELRRRLPDTVVVRVNERQPIGIARLHDELYLVDSAGGVIDEFGPRYADCDLPIIDGLLVPGERGFHVDDTRGKLVADMMADVRRRPDVARRISQVDVADALDLRVILDGDPTVLRLGDTRFLERIWSYIGLQASLRQRVPDISYVDLRFDDRVYVGPATMMARNSQPAGGGPAAPRAGTSTGTEPAQARRP